MQSGLPVYEFTGTFCGTEQRERPLSRRLACKYETPVEAGWLAGPPPSRCQIFGRPPTCWQAMLGTQMSPILLPFGMSNPVYALRWNQRLRRVWERECLLSCRRTGAGC
jgi:hypothetical protein